MRRVLQGILETAAGVAIFVAFIAAYNWLAPWEPDSWSWIQTQIGWSIWVVGVVVGALLGGIWLVWRAITAIGRHVRGAGK